MSRTLTAGDLASALIAACTVLKLSPAEVYETPGRKARILAGAALKAATRCTARALAGPLKIADTELAPSMLARKQITTDMLLEVVEAIGGPAGAAEISQGLASPEAAAQPVRDQPIKLEPAAPSVAQGRIVGAEAQPGAAKPVARAGAKPEPRTEPRRLRKTAVQRREYLAPRAVASASAPVRPSVRLRAVTERTIRFARWFLAADWDFDEVADLFNVNPTALADALEFGVAA